MGVYHRRSNPRTQASTTATNMIWVVGICGLLMSVAPGCRSGATAMAAPSWWSFGGSAAADPSKLTSAPPFDGKIPKPSESATPYPTTTTPKGYEVTEATKAAPAIGATAAAPSAEPTAVTYGTKPPATPQPSGMQQAAAAPPSNPAAIAPQVGPYASLAGQTPASEPPLQPVAPAASQPAASAFSSALPPAAKP